MLEEKSDNEIKAMIYDCIAQLQAVQGNINALEAELKRRSEK